MNGFKGALKLIKAQSNAGLRMLWQDWLPAVSPDVRSEKSGPLGNSLTDEEYEEYRRFYSAGYSPEEVISFRAGPAYPTRGTEYISDATVEASKHLAQAKLELQLIENLDLGGQVEFVNSIINKIEDLQYTLARWRKEQG